MTSLGPVIGIDISKWDGKWDAAKAKTQGATFVYIKASQATYTDPQFLQNWQKAKDAGLLRGAYHYLDYTKPGKDQANAFADLIKSDPGELPPVIDYEQSRSDNNPAAALSILRECLDQMLSKAELYADSAIKAPMLYISPGFWAEYGDTTKREYWLQFPLWLAHYTTSMSPQLPTPWPMWKFWQFTAKGPGEVFGSECLTMDMNRFNGTLSELMEFAGVRVPVVNLNEMVDTLAQRTKVVEDALAAMSPSGDLSASNLVQRVTALETIVAGLGTSTAPTVPSPAPSDTTSPATPDPVSGTTPSTPADPTPAAGSDLYAICNTSALNVRSGPAFTYPMVAGIYMGQRVKILKRQNGWAQIENPAGWSNESYLTYDNAGTTPVADAPQMSSPDIYGVCNTSGLNVRGGPGVAFPIVGGLTYGQRAKILSRKSGWAQIEKPAGWCNESYLSFA
jgi:GH25 family lysozyme M1 (1,4-beta-N-acetylmuramidase)/uncharacterized protein YraI